MYDVVNMKKYSSITCLHQNCALAILCHSCCCCCHHLLRLQLKYRYRSLSLIALSQSTQSWGQVLAEPLVVLYGTKAGCAMKELMEAMFTIALPPLHPASRTAATKCFIANAYLCQYINCFQIMFISMGLNAYTSPFPSVKSPS